MLFLATSALLYLVLQLATHQSLAVVLCIYHLYLQKLPWRFLYLGVKPTCIHDCVGGDLKQLDKYLVALRLRPWLLVVVPRDVGQSV